MNYKVRYQPLWKYRPHKWYFHRKLPSLTLLHLGPMEFLHKRAH